MRKHIKYPISFLARMAVWLAQGITMVIFGGIILYILIRGLPYLTPSLFAWSYTTQNASMLPALINTVFMTVLSLLISVPAGIGAAIYLVEYAKRKNRLVKMVWVTTRTLTGIPSIVYGLFGALCFTTALKWKLSLLSGACTLSVMVLPVIITTTEEALLSVTEAYRTGSYGLGAGKLRTIFRVVLPCSVPGILSGVLLAVGRILGETAALIYTAGSISKVPDSVFDSARTLAVHTYVLSKEGKYTNEAYATAVVLLLLVLLINYGAGLLADKLTGKKDRN